MNVGIMGMGVVGNATAEGLKRGHTIIAYDKYKSEYHTVPEVAGCSVVFICVPTPMKKSGEINLNPIKDSVQQLITNGFKGIIVVKSTAVSGTTDKLAKAHPGISFAFNPEFLTEKNAVQDFLQSDRVIIGANDSETFEKIAEVYSEARFECPIFHVNIKTAEMIKYVANTFLATKVTFANEIYNICQSLDIDYEQVKKMVMLDARIGNTHLDVPGNDGDLGFGGKCLIAGTKIRKENEIVNIEDLKVGNKIYDDDGITEVTKIGARKVEETILVSARGRSLIGSIDHRHLIVDGDNIIEKEFKDIKVGEYIYVPKQKEFKNSSIVILGEKPTKYHKWWHSSFKINNDFARLIGLYLAEGCSGRYNGKYTILWSYGESKEDLADETVVILNNIGLKCKKRFVISNGTYGESRCWVIRIRSEGLYKIFEKLGLGNCAHNKVPPLFNNELSKYIIGGWLDGDGNYYKGTLSGTSVNKDMVMRFDSLLLSLGVNASIHNSCNNSWTIRISQRKDVKKVSSWSKSKRLKYSNNKYKRNVAYASPTSKRYKNGWKIKINKIEALSGQEVYSLETKSHKYIANNTAVHNCFPKDLNALIYLARQQGLRAHLLTEVWRSNLNVRKKIDWINELKED